MGKASDILNKTGAASKVRGPEQSLLPKAGASLTATTDEAEHAATKKQEPTAHASKAAKAKGGGGGSSARPKV